jgi:hypothetical protein
MQERRRKKKQRCVFPINSFLCVKLKKKIDGIAALKKKDNCIMEENFNVRAQTSPKGKCVTWSMGFITDKVNWCSLFVRINKSLIITLNCHYYVGAPPTKYVQNRISFSVGWLHLN